ncbi:LytTR family DNA-binding domain-containing protein [Sphingobacterium sp. KU25419]|nr:LytTR family DNA-binding domain-containing protein [Sphingobacterium sp. KU25419]
MDETLNCYILDDQPHAIELLRRYIERTEGLTLVGSAEDPLVAVNEIMAMKTPLNVLFADIDLPGMNGLEVSGAIGDLTKTVFITAFDKYAVSSYEHGAVDYILKPISYERFLIAVARVRERMAGRSGLAIADQGTFIFPGERKNKIFRVKREDIICGEASAGHVKLYLSSGNRTAYLSLRHFAETINGTTLIQVHRSFIVNMDRIKEVDSNLIVMDNNMEIRISKEYRSRFHELFVQGAIRPPKQA